MIVYSCVCGTVHSSQQRQIFTTNITCSSHAITVNLGRKNSRPCEQDYTFLGYASINGQVHKKFSYQGITGVEMSGEQSSDRMVIAVPVSEGVKIDLQEAFKLRTFKQDLVLNSDGGFHHPMLLKQVMTTVQQSV
jgi:hypothetical protein